MGPSVHPLSVLFYRSFGSRNSYLSVLKMSTTLIISYPLFFVFFFSRRVGLIIEYSGIDLQILLTYVLLFISLYLDMESSRGIFSILSYKLLFKKI